MFWNVNNLSNASSQYFESLKSLNFNASRVPDSQVNLTVLAFVVLFALSFLIGITANLLVIIVFASKKMLRNYTNSFFINLSIADILVILACLPIAITDLFSHETWYYGYLYCNLNLLFYTNIIEFY